MSKFNYLAFMKAVIKESRLAHIIDSAELVFFEKGYSKANISDICKVAQCSRTTLYSYFSTKQNIYLAVAKKAFQKFLHFFSALDLDENNGLDTILVSAKGYLDFCKEFPKHYQLIMDFYGLLKNREGNEALTESHLLLVQSQYFEKVKSISEIPLQFLIHQIKQGQQDKSISTNSTAEIHLINIWAYLKGISSLLNLAKDTQDASILGMRIDNLENTTLTTIEKMLT